jgi:hypothetical protein
MRFPYSLTPGTGPGAIAFGGQPITLSFAEVLLELIQDGNVIRSQSGMADSSANEGDGEMTGLESLQAVQFVTVRGRRLAVLNAEDWESLVEWLETLEDVSLAKEAQANRVCGQRR